MKKSVKIALKRFIVLLICMVMVITLFAAMDHVDTSVKITIGVICLVLTVVYWVYALITIRRDEQKKKSNKGKK